jgi:hypothetical protein
LLSAVILLGTLATAKGAPQEAAGAAIALAVAVIPYVFTRAIEAFEAAAWREKMLAATESSNANYKIGVESLLKQLESMRAPILTMSPDGATSHAPAARPIASGMGYCPQCSKLRGLEVGKCVYCGNTDPAKAYEKQKET